MHSTTRAVRSAAPLPSSELVLAGTLALLLTACSDDGVLADTEAADADTEPIAGASGAEESGTDGAHGPGLEGIPTPGDGSGSTTAVADETGDATTDETPAQGSCVGHTSPGSIALVLSRGGMPIDTTCDSTPAPCGGDPGEGWRLEAMCGFEDVPNPLESQCPGSTFTIEILSHSGTMIFGADGTMVQDFDIVAEMTFTLDTMACFGLSCAAFEAQLETPEGTPPPTCEAVGTTCACTFPDDGLAEQATASWEVMGTDLVFTTDDVTRTFPFCVTAERLEIWQPFHDMPVPTDVACDTPQDCIDALGDMYDSYACSPSDAPGG